MQWMCSVHWRTHRHVITKQHPLEGALDLWQDLSSCSILCFLFQYAFCFLFFTIQFSLNLWIFQTYSPFKSAPFIRCVYNINPNCDAVMMMMMINSDFCIHYATNTRIHTVYPLYLHKFHFIFRWITKVRQTKNMNTYSQTLLNGNSNNNNN